MKALDALIAAAAAYGDAAKRSRDALYAWEAGTDRAAMQEANQARCDAEWRLKAAAKAYAAATRKKRARPATPDAAVAAEGVRRQGNT